MNSLQVLSPGGLLVMGCCSYHTSQERLLEAIGRAANESGRAVRVFRLGTQGPDHPINPGVPETRYLKCIFGSVE